MQDPGEIIAELRKEARRRFAVKIDWIKKQVGPGVMYSNSLVRVCLSPFGGWYEFLNMPEEFSGWVGCSPHRFIGDLETKSLAQMILELSLHANKQNTRKLKLIVAYGTDIWTASYEDVYMCEFDTETAIPRSVGDPTYRRIPLFLKLNADSILPPLEGRAMMIILFSEINDQNLVVELPQSGSSDLSKGSLPTIH